MIRLITLFTALFVTTSCIAQIPNGDFETWDSSAGYQMPVGWDNMNPVTTSTSFYTCQRMDPGYSGYSIKLGTLNVPGIGIVPGIAVSGRLDHTSYLPISGFPYTLRPQVLAGEWQYMAYSSADQGFITIFLSKWNSGTSHRDTIAYTRYDLPDMVMAWTAFHIPLYYYSSASPDSAMVVLSASGSNPLVYSILMVDDLRFADSLTLGAENQFKLVNELSVFPNPAKEKFTLSYNSVSGNDTHVSISDLSGRTIKTLTLKVSKGMNTNTINTADLSKGFYIIKIEDEQGIQVKKLIID